CIRDRGVPSILIPYPYAADNHQEKNADEFVSKGAAIKIANDDAVPEKVGPVLLDLLKNPAKLERMRQAAYKSAKINAATEIVAHVLQK
ncbi:MAG: hypothetical protein N2316_13075, partial [Spirochaetes bacterium]|nr:hypothetical protein [Spirochaetota bacterium]